MVDNCWILANVTGDGSKGCGIDWNIQEGSIDVGIIAIIAAIIVIIRRSISSDLIDRFLGVREVRFLIRRRRRFVIG